MNVPFLGPKRGFAAHQAEFEKTVAEVAARGYYILGPHVESLEKAVAAQ